MPNENPQQVQSFAGYPHDHFQHALSSLYFGYAMVYLPAIDFVAIYRLYDIGINYQLAQRDSGGVCADWRGVWGLCRVPCLLGSSAEGKRFCYIVRNCLLIVNALAILSIFLLYVQNFNFFVFARMFQGFCTGLLSSIAPAMMKELAPTEISGTLTVATKSSSLVEQLSDSCFSYAIFHHE